MEWKQRQILRREAKKFRRQEASADDTDGITKLVSWTKRCPWRVSSLNYRARHLPWLQHSCVKRKDTQLFCSHVAMG